jgi:type I restriction enzyme S subunit
LSWLEVKLGDIGEFKAGYGFPHKYQGNSTGKIPFAKVGDISTVARSGEKYIQDARHFISRSDLTDIKAKTVPINTIVFAKIGEAIKQNFRAVTACEMVIDNNSMGLVPDTKQVDVNYLYHFMCKLDLYQFTGATTVPAIRKSVLEELKIPLPPLTEQKRIAAILDKADAIRRKRQQAIQLADDFLRAVFLDMFGDPVINPKGWEESPLISLIDGKCQNGVYFPKEEYTDDGIEMVHMGDAFYDLIKRGNLKRVRAKEMDINKYGLTDKDLIISRRSLTYEGAAKPSLIPESNEPLIFESSMIRITPNKNKINIRFLFQYLSDPLVKDHFIRKFVTGATIKGISQRNLEQVRVLVPPMELQRKFTIVLDRIEQVKKTQSLSEKSSIETFKSLSQKAFAGKI